MRHELFARCVRRRGAAIRQIPFEHQSDFDHHRVDVENRNRIGDLRRQWQSIGKRVAMQDGERIGGSLIAFGDRTRRLTLDKNFAAEILGDQEARIEVGVMDGGR